VRPSKMGSEAGKEVRVHISFVAYLIGRILVGLYYLYNALNHFKSLDMMAGYAGSKGVPAPKLAVAGSGVLLAVGGLSLLTGFEPRLGVAAVVLFLVPVTLTMHQFWRVSDPMQKMGEQVNFMKNVALLGSTLMFLVIPRPWPYSV